MRKKPVVFVSVCTVLFLLLAAIMLQSTQNYAQSISDAVAHLDDTQDSSAAAGDTTVQFEPVPASEDDSLSNKPLEQQQKLLRAEYGIYADLFEVLAQSRPECGHLKNYKKDNTDLQKFVSDKTSFTKEYLENLLPLTKEEKELMTKSYHKALEGFQKLSMSVFGRDDKKHHIKGKGIVMVGGYKFSWLSLLNIHQLRRRGSKLPVEVYIPTVEEYDEQFCETVLPQLGARCVLGYEQLPFTEYEKYFNLQRYEYKIMAILTSSFDDVLLLDSDNVVLENPDELFNWDTYKKFQLILWPDCWQRTTNPFLFDLLNVSVDYSSVTDMSSYNLHDLPGAVQNPSTESGMLLVNKHSQLETLLLSLYLNIYGFDYYYPLITQGGAGQGDKDTYMLAAYGAEKPVYQVKHKVSFLGRFEKDGGFTSGALGQCNPMTQAEADAYANQDAPGCSHFTFLHLSFPKFYPNEIVGKLKGPDGHILEFDGIDWGYDFELQIWEIMCQLLCTNYKKNDIQPENEASALLEPKYRLTGQELSYIKTLGIDHECDANLLPHLQFLRKYFKYADKSKKQFEQDWEGKNEE